MKKSGESKSLTLYSPTSGAWIRDNHVVHRRQIADKRSSQDWTIHAHRNSHHRIFVILPKSRRVPLSMVPLHPIVQKSAAVRFLHKSFRLELCRPAKGNCKPNCIAIITESNTMNKHLLSIRILQRRQNVWCVRQTLNDRIEETFILFGWIGQSTNTRERCFAATLRHFIMTPRVTYSVECKSNKRKNWFIFSERSVSYDAVFPYLSTWSNAHILTLLLSAAIFNTNSNVVQIQRQILGQQKVIDIWLNNRLIAALTWCINAIVFLTSK